MLREILVACKSVLLRKLTFLEGGQFQKVLVSIGEDITTVQNEEVVRLLLFEFGRQPTIYGQWKNSYSSIGANIVTHLQAELDRQIRLLSSEFGKKMNETSLNKNYTATA